MQKSPWTLSPSGKNEKVFQVCVIVGPLISGMKRDSLKIENHLLFESF